MRFGFERNISAYNEIAKDEVEGGLTPEEERDLDAELRSRIRRVSQERKTPESAQQYIYNLQIRKQEIMHRLKERLAHIDDAPKRPGETPVTAVDGRLIAKSERGEEIEVTEGEVITDMEWGKYYYLDPLTVGKHLRKRYLVEDAKHELQNLLNMQITEDEVSSRYTSPQLRGAYERKSLSEGKEFGEIAEVIIKNFLKKLSIDFSASFELVEADVHLDITKKVDFIIRRKAHRRGVGVEEAEKDAVGIQFTTSVDPARIQHKEEQLEHARGYLKPSDRLDDIMLVKVPRFLIEDAYDEWMKTEAPGGPDKLLPSEIKEQIFREVMKGILTPEEIDEEWGRVVRELAPT